MNAQLSMLTAIHYTPSDIIQRVSNVFYGIDLDPCGSRQSQKIVQARQYFTKAEDGLKQAWTYRSVHSYREFQSWRFTCSHIPASVYINPPGSRNIKPSLPMQFWEKLMKEVSLGNVSHAIYMGYSLEQLQQCQYIGLEIFRMTSYPICIPNKRIKFLHPTLEPQTSPTHANFLVYVPGTINRVNRFKENFADIGAFLNC